MRRFLSFFDCDDPETALQKLQSGEVSGSQKVDQFIDFALEKYSHGSVRSFLFGIKKWFDLNGININWKKTELLTSTEITETDRVPSKGELKTLLNHASSSRDRTAILIVTSSGLRLGTLLSLKLGNINMDYLDVATLKVE